MKMAAIASPAHAGMHPMPSRRGAVGARFPRTRGDAPRKTPENSISRLLPPHTRGCTLDRAKVRDYSHASPAHAGMHPRNLHGEPEPCGFPRTRGDAP